MVAATCLFAQLPHFQQHTLSIPQVEALELNCLAQSADGVLWIGTNRGLVRYNGSNPSFFATETPVTALISVQKELWVGYQNGQIGVFKNNQIQILQTKDSLPKSKITAFVTDLKGQIWVSTAGEGVYVFENQRLIPFTIKDGLSNSDIYTLVAVGNQIYTATDNGIQILKYQKGQKTIENRAGVPLSDVIVKTLAHNTESTLFGGFFNNSVQNLTTGQTRQVGGAVSCMALFSKQGLCVGTETNGLYFVDFQLDRTDLAPPSVGKHIQAMLRDDEGNIWFISDHTKLFSAKTRFLTYKTPLTDMQTLTATADNQLLIGTKKGAFQYDLKDGQITRILSEKTNIISAFRRSGRQFFGTYGTGLIEYTAGKTQVLGLENGLSNLNIFSINSRDDTLWLGTLGGVDCLLPQTDGTWTVQNLSKTKGQSAQFIYTIFEDQSHRIWLGTDGKGAAFFDGQKFHFFEKTAKTNQNIGSVIGIVESPKGKIWLANTEGGIFYGTIEQGFTLLPNLQNRPASSFSGLCTDSRGNLLFLAADGIEFMNPMTFNRSFFSHEIGISSFETSGLNPFALSNISDIWLATATDLVRLPPPFKHQRTQPTILLRGVKVHSQNIDFQSINTFKTNQNYFVFDIESIWLTHPQAVHFRYKLEGLESDWQPTREHLVSYPNLQHGTYTFRVQSSLSADFTGASEAVYRFTISSPIWQQWWFIGLAVALLTALVFVVVNFREKKLRQIEAQKREKIETQLQLIRSQINPHFLFNSFNTLVATIEDNPNAAVEYTQKLSDFYRNILHIREQDLISVGEELDFLNNYLFLLQKRHGKSLEVLVEIKDLDRKIVPLTLQILVENAVKHNIVSQKHPLSIEIRETPDACISVKNNRQIKRDKETGTGFGLSSLSNRYQLLAHRKVEVAENAADRLHRMVNKLLPEASVLAQLDSVESTLEFLDNQPTPDLLLLDIHLADGSCFDIFKHKNLKTPIIFTTAYSEYALPAFKTHAIDFLLKPIKEVELAAAFEKFRDFYFAQKPTQTLDNQSDTPPQYIERFLVKTGQSYRVVLLSDIAYIVSEEKIAFATRFDGKRFAVDFTMDKLESLLSPTEFYRLNRQFLVRLKAIDEMSAYSKSRIKVKLNPIYREEVIVSSEKSADFKRWLVGDFA
jgi:ligand-binding sensor domain-containing protein/DNA-binding LytR/AlgR family response regulator